MQIDQFKLKNPDIIAVRAHIDMPLLSAFLVIFIISGVAIFSASNGNISFLIDHSTKIIVSIIAMIIAAQIKPMDYMRIAPWLYFICMVLLILVLVIGETRNNATRWLSLGITFQPSELMKIAMPLMIAGKESFDYNFIIYCAIPNSDDFIATRSWYLCFNCFLWSSDYFFIRY